MPQSTARQLIDCHPLGYHTLDRKKLEAAILALSEAAQVATANADAVLNANLVRDMRDCLRACLDAADVCEAAARVLSRATGYDQAITEAVLAAAVAVLNRCGDECARHASMHMHCRLAAESVRRAAGKVEEMIGALGGIGS
jgi:hypothetical protein